MNKYILAIAYVEELENALITLLTRITYFDSIEELKAYGDSTYVINSTSYSECMNSSTGHLLLEYQEDDGTSYVGYFEGDEEEAKVFMQRNF